jgi:uncharacterized protein YchJ
MKTTRNLNQIAKVTLASVTFLFASLMPIQATSGKNASSEMNEIQAASNSLAMYNLEVEKTVAFNAPVLSENSVEFEAFVAESRLNDLFSSASKDAQYVSPSVNEDFDAAVAMENLDQMNAQIEQSVKYTASIAE